jgi:hypothetical protein
VQQSQCILYTGASQFIAVEGVLISGELRLNTRGGYKSGQTLHASHQGRVQHEGGAGKENVKKKSEKEVARTGEVGGITNQIQRKKKRHTRHILSFALRS